MATFRIPLLVVKPLAQGGYGYYWQPSPTLAKKGWKPVNLGIAARPDDPERQDAARRRNDEVAAWRAGGAKPRAVKTFARRETVAALIAAWKESAEFEKLRDNTQRTYRSALAIIEVWATDPRQPGGAGNLALALIDIDRVEKFRDGLMKPLKKGDPPRHTRAHNTLRVLRTLLEYGVRRKFIDANPAAKFQLATPAPRDQIWQVADVDAFKAAAELLGYPSLAFAVELAEYTGQREADILTMHAGQWREMRGLDRETHDACVGPDGRVMGIHVRQGKTRRWVGIPIEGALRRRVEAAIATNAARETPATTLLTDDRTGRPWQNRWFIAKFVEAKALAIAPGKVADADLRARAKAAGLVARPELDGLQFRDLRRTCVVRLGELGLEDALISAITGHMLGSIKTILEVYMPRTNKMAGRAVVARLRADPAPPAAADRQRGTSN